MELGEFIDQEVDLKILTHEQPILFSYYHFSRMSMTKNSTINIEGVNYNLVNQSYQI